MIRRTHLGFSATPKQDASTSALLGLEYAVIAYGFLLKPGEALNAEQFIQRIKDHYDSDPATPTGNRFRFLSADIREALP
jgi:hypothetical protein